MNRPAKITAATIFIILFVLLILVWGLGFPVSAPPAWLVAWTDWLIKVVGTVFVAWNVKPAANAINGLAIRLKGDHKR
jgi:hypothetical protein